MTYSGGHSPNLAVFSFNERYADPCVRNFLAKPYRWISWWYFRSRLKYGCRAGKAAVSPDDDRASA